MDYLGQLDRFIFECINGFHSPFFDHFFLLISNKYFWIPFYLVLSVVIISRFRKNSILILVAIFLSILLSDQLTSTIIKPNVQRLRPCHEPHLSESLHLVGNCGGEYGFASGHAANSFALAVFIFLLFGKVKWWPIFAWAGLISYSRIYLGVHYPADVLAGSVIGLLIGFLVFQSFRMITKY